MKRLCCLCLVGAALLWEPAGWPSPAFAGSAQRQAEDYRSVPHPLRLFADQWMPRPPPPSDYTPEFLRTADDETSSLTLREAVLVGLENNPGIEVSRLEPLRAAEDTMLEKSIFDPALTLEFAKDFNIDPRGTTASTFFQPLQRTRNRDYDLSVKKLLRTGAQVEISLLNNRLVSSVPNQVLKPQYRPHLEVTLLQPLLRDFGLGLTTIFVRIADNREQAGLFDYQTRLAQLVQKITEAYWAVVFARENLTVQQKGVELADALLKGAEAKVRAGVLAPIAVLEAKAEKARREALVIGAENELAIARSSLRLTLHLNPNRMFLPRKIDAADWPSVFRMEVDAAASRASALTRRPEILAADLAVQNQALALRYVENQLLPRLDLKAGAGLTGLAGELKAGQTSPFPGNYGTAIDRLGSGRYYDYSVGVVLQFPLGNAQAKSNFAKSRIELDQGKARLRDLVSQVTLEVERALADVEASFKRIQSTGRAREFAEENLRGQERRYEVGLVSQKDVIDFQSRFLEARAEELRALTDYNNATSRLRQAEGRLLDHYNVRIEGPKKSPDPWWARF
jgi:outer membrane protein TolC